MNQALEYFKELFSFTEGKPLIFTQLFFWGFFGVVLILYSLIYKRIALRNIYLLLVSFFFYFKTSGVFLILMIFTICSDFIWGKLISKTESNLKRKLFLTISVILNLGLLSYFKYAYFFTESCNQLFHTQFQFFNHFSQFSNHFFGTKFSVDKLILPIGISFFTFQSLSYTIDLYRKKIQAVTNVFDYGFFVCFFPHLVAGPIVKAHEFMHQIKQPYHLTRTEFGLAVFWILNGLGKKIIADYMAVNFVDRIFDNPNYYSGVEVIFGIFGYSMQIYADFSGYTDIAIGIALLLGFRLKTNFRSPYKAASTSEFWQRWHISLSSWLKEYLYIPLGGNRHGTIGSYIAISILAIILVMLTGHLWLLLILLGLAMIFVLLAYFIPSFKNYINTNINLMVTMLLGGLWHGSSWLFIIWGGLNGLGLVIHKLWEKISPFKNNHSMICRGAGIFITLCFISFTRIFFRSDSMNTVTLLFDRMGHHMGFELTFNIIRGYALVFSVIGVSYIIHWIPETIKDRYRHGFANLPLPVMVIGIVAVVFSLYQFMSGDMQPFIYFQF